jgi:hypothetical protein
MPSVSLRSDVIGIIGITFWRWKSPQQGNRLIEHAESFSMVLIGDNYKNLFVIRLPPEAIHAVTNLDTKPLYLIRV